MVKVINTYGVPVVNQALIQDANGPVTSAVRTLLSYQEPDFIIYSGYMTYIENRTAIQRSSDGNGTIPCRVKILIWKEKLATNFTCDFNVDPYYDDFDSGKNYHRILFKP
jgi:hypothetical protein